MISMEALRSVCRGRVALSEPLRTHCALGVGGPADLVVEPVDRTDLVATLRYFREVGLPFCAVGGGTTLLVSDDGYRGAVVLLGDLLTAITVGGTTLRAEAGARFGRMASLAVQHRLVGLESVAGLNGTVGGALALDRSQGGVRVRDLVARIEVLRGAEVTTLRPTDVRFGDGDSSRGDVILSAEFPLREVAPIDAATHPDATRTRRHRTGDPPGTERIFRDPTGDRARRLIESAGLKGVRVGGATVGSRGGLVNLTGEATAADFIELIRQVRQAVKAHFGVTLELELRLVGFDPVWSRAFIHGEEPLAA